MLQTKISIALIGATGPVGQKVISMLENHPYLEIREIAASGGNQGKKYRDAASWKNEMPLPENIGAMILKNVTEVESHYVISALPTDTALELEPLLASRGQFIFSNASAFRMAENVPLLVPEINLAHLSLLERQATKGKIVTNPNCSTVFLTAALAPLLELGKIEHVSAVTMQALSGAGYPGVSAFDLLGNIIPHISGEEEKIQQETKKILGAAGKPADFKVTVHVHRVPVLHGHTIAAHVRFDRAMDARALPELYRAWNQRHPGLYELHEAVDRPQPLRDLTPHDQRVHIGRIKQGDDAHTVGFISMGHNLIRGAAGAAIGNLEAFLATSGAIRR